MKRIGAIRALTCPKQGNLAFSPICEEAFAACRAAKTNLLVQKSAWCWNTMRMKRTCCILWVNWSRKRTLWVRVGQNTLHIFFATNVRWSGTKLCRNVEEHARHPCAKSRARRSEFKVMIADATGALDILYSGFCVGWMDTDRQECCQQCFNQYQALDATRSQSRTQRRTLRPRS